MNTQLFVQKYLERIKLQDELHPDRNTLIKIHRQHLLNIPFENLSIFENRKIEFDTEKLFTKIVTQKRGGICYELNGLLFHLLKCIGFKAKYLSARVLDDGNEFDHVLIMVQIESDRYLADVGFGDNFLEPLKFDLDTVHKDLKGYFKITRAENSAYTLLKSADGLEYSAEYTFSLSGRSLDDFRERCSYFETSPESRFRKKRLCSLERENGRISLSDNKLTMTQGEIREEKKIENDSEFDLYLKEVFDIQIV